MFGRKADQNRDQQTYNESIDLRVIPGADFFYKAVSRSFYRSTITRMKKSLFHYCVIDKKDLVLAEILLRFGADPSQDRS